MTQLIRIKGKTYFVVSTMEGVLHFGVFLNCSIEFKDKKLLCMYQANKKI